MTHPERNPAIRVRDLQFDERNRNHLIRHNLDHTLCRDVLGGSPRFFENARGAGRTGSHVMISSDSAGRFWTIILVHVREAPLASDYRLAEYEPGDSTMPRRGLTKEEEERLIEDAVAARESSAPLLPVEAVVGLPDKIPVTLRLPRDTFQAFRALAQDRGMPLADLLIETLATLSPGHESLRRPA